MLPAFLTLQERVRQFNLGTPTPMHVGTHELVNELWRELEKRSVHHVALAAEQGRENRSSTVETGWLLEMSTPTGPTYYGMTTDEGLGFTRDHLAALRYARREDAQATIDDIGWTEVAAVEHQWSDPEMPGGQETIEGGNWHPDWHEVMADCGGADKCANDLVMVTRETARLAVSAISEQQSKEAYHNFAAAHRELTGVLDTGAP